MTGIDEAITGDRGPADELTVMFRWFAANSYGDSSPIYRAVIETVADDPDLLAVVKEAPHEAHHPGVLLASVKFLLAGGIDHPLARCYLAGHAEHDDLGAIFRSFVLDHREAILDTMRVRRVQTNEVARTAVLAPVVREVQRRVDQSLALIDVGTSAGLNLLLDEVHVDYGHARLGRPDSMLTLRCEALGDGPPPGPELDIAWRVGLDQEPMDLSDVGDRRWLEACIWPEHTDRLERLAVAASMQADDPPRLVRGDAVDALSSLIAEVPDDLALVVMTSWVFVYLSGRQRAEFERILASANRPVAWVSAEFPDVVRNVEPIRPPRSAEEDISKVAVVWFPGTGEPERREFIGWSHNHGAWLDW